MINEANFIIRKSGRREGVYYIDYLGKYKAEDISKIIGTDLIRVKDMYIECKGIYDDNQDVFYFPSIQNAQEAIDSLMKKVTAKERGRFVLLSDDEIIYIKKALISDSTTKNCKLKDSVFSKLSWVIRKIKYKQA